MSGISRLSDSRRVQSCDGREPAKASSITVPSSSAMVVNSACKSVSTPIRGREYLNGVAICSAASEVDIGLRAWPRKSACLTASHVLYEMYPSLWWPEGGDTARTNHFIVDIIHTITVMRYVSRTDRLCCASRRGGKTLRLKKSESPRDKCYKSAIETLHLGNYNARMPL